MSLTHNFPECTGRWGLHTIYLASYWECDRCGAISDASVQSYAKAIHENLMGDRLDHLTREGRKLLDQP